MVCQVLLSSGRSWECSATSAISSSSAIPRRLPFAQSPWLQALGRLLNPSDDAASAPPVAVLSHSYWQRRFGGDARVIGQILRLNTSAVTIVGVTAAAFRGITLGASPDITLAMGSSAELFRGRGILENGGNWWLRIIGRRKDGISIQQVQASLEPIFQRTIEHSMSSLPAELASRIRGYVSGIRFGVQPATACGASV